MFNVDMTRLKRPLENRGLSHIKNDNGTVTINDITFDRESDVESYLEGIQRTDIPSAL